MGGHSAWRKRVARGEPMKGAGGAALRHRPHLGRKGKDLALNRLGNIGGRPNPKNKSKRDKNVLEEKKKQRSRLDPSLETVLLLLRVVASLGVVYLVVVVAQWKSFRQLLA